MENKNLLTIPAISRTAMLWYVGLSIALTLAIGLLFPGMFPGDGNTTVMRMAVLAGCISFALSHMPGLGFYLTLFVVFTEPMLGIKTTELTQLQDSYTHYYLWECLILIMGFGAPLLFDGQKKKFIPESPGRKLDV